MTAARVETIRPTFGDDTSSSSQTGERDELCLHTRTPCSGKSMDPSLLVPLSTQIAGHGSEGNGQRAILKRPDGRLLKPIQSPPRGQREMAFYISINRSKDPVDIKIRQHIPEFFGVERIYFDKNIVSSVGEDFLILRDATEGFILPAILDVKIGSQTYGPDASSKKKQLEDSKYVGTKHPFGFSVLGFIVHSLRGQDEGSNNEDLGDKYDKNFGKNLKTEDVHTVPEIFFDLHRSGFLSVLVNIMLEKIKKVYKVFEDQRKYLIYSSSLLMAYDAFAVRQFNNGNLDRQELEKHVNVRLIDFAHVFESDGRRDDNFLHGLENLISLFETFYFSQNSALKSIENA